MINKIKKIVLLAGLALGAKAATAADFPIGFQVWNAPVPPMATLPGSMLAKANQAFMIKYGAEAGLLGTAQGSRGDLVILVAAPRFSRDIWVKMIGAGDAYAGAGGAGFFRFQDDTIPQPPQYRYSYLGRLSIAEGATGSFYLQNGTPAIKGYMVAMEENCGLTNSGVFSVDPNQALQPTRLTGTRRNGSYTIEYEYAVNGGYGALVSAINVTIARHRGPFIIDICPVDVYLRF